MTDQILQRASLLIQHRRYEDAQKELRQILASEPNHPYAHALLGVSFTELGNHDEALKHIETALGQQPDYAYYHYLQGLVRLRKGKQEEAVSSVLTAINFDPHNADYYGLISMIRLDEKNWEEALTFANRGLQADPENLVCLNSRSTALLKLNRKEESYQTIKEALHNDPHNAHTHANLGWGLLEQGKHKEALESFRESLKLDPENNYAKAGLVEALKARYWFYRAFLKYVFWIQNKNTKYQWAFMIGIYIGIRLLNGVSRTYPALAPIATPIVFLYTLFALSTWIVTPLSNLFLRFNIYGRYALNDDQIKASNFTGAGAVLMIAGLVGLIITGSGFFVNVMILGIGFMILLSSMFNPQNQNKRRIAILLASALCLCGTVSLVISFLGGEAGVLWLVFLFGAFAYQWIINALITR